MKTTKKDFELFKSECLKWIDRLGLTDWNVTFKHRPLNNVQAHTQYDCNASSVCFSLDANLDSKTGAFTTSIEDSAKHEVLHLLLARLFYKATARYINDGELDEAEHGIIARLIKAL